MGLAKFKYTIKYLLQNRQIQAPKFTENFNKFSLFLQCRWNSRSITKRLRLDSFYMILPWNCQILHCSAVCTYLYTGTQELQVIVKVGIFEFQRPFQILNWIRLENQKTCAKLGCVITSSLSPVLNSINHLPLHLQSGIKFERSVVIEWTF